MKLIACCAGVADVLACVNFARANKVRVSVRGGDHNAGGSALCDGGLTIDLTPMKSVRVDPTARTVDVLQTKGVFRHLENHWKFVPDGDYCRIDFRIAFEFRSKILGFVADAALGQVLTRMTDAFEKRAKALSKKSA